MFEHEAPVTVAATFAATLVDEWVRAGVQHAVVSPGSRSTPLALALAAESRLRVHVHPDERAASFIALGIGAASEHPAVMLTTGDADTRVPPLQARKMTARLQAATNSGNPIVLLYDTQAGHAGGRPQSKIIEDNSLEYAFLFWQLGMDWQSPN